MAERVTPLRAHLYPAELEVIRYLSHGLGVDDIARLRYVSPNTVRKQVKTARQRLAAKTAAHAVAIALRHGLID